MTFHQRDQNISASRSSCHLSGELDRTVAGLTNPTRQDGTHALRHHYASVVLDAGEGINELSEYLGHHDPGFTLRTYRRLMPNSTVRTQRAIGGLFR